MNKYKQNLGWILLALSGVIACFVAMTISVYMGISLIGEAAYEVKRDVFFFKMLAGFSSSYIVYRFSENISFLINEIKSLKE